MSGPNTSGAARGSANPSDWLVHRNLSQIELQVTEDKVRLCLKTQLEKSNAKGAWHTPFCLLVSILATLTTSTFKDDAFLKKEGWEALFRLGALVCLVWSLAAAWKSWRAPNRDQLIGNIVREMKGQAPPVLTSSVRGLFDAMTEWVQSKTRKTAPPLALPAVAVVPQSAPSPAAVPSPPRSSKPPPSH
jgi:hypothetical protein